VYDNANGFCFEISDDGSFHNACFHLDKGTFERYGTSMSTGASYHNSFKLENEKEEYQKAPGFEHLDVG
jgi:hypothetical protein